MHGCIVTGNVDAKYFEAPVQASVSSGLAYIAAVKATFYRTAIRVAASIIRVQICRRFVISNDETSRSGPCLIAFLIRHASFEFTGRFNVSPRLGTSYFRGEIT